MMFSKEAALVVVGGLLCASHQTAASSTPIVPDQYYVLETAAQAMSAHKVCTPDESLCVKQDRVVAILMVKNRSDTENIEAVENFGKIGRFFPKGSLSFFVTDSQEVFKAYEHITGGLGPTIIVITPFKLDGTKKPGNPLVYMLPRKTSVNENHKVTEWLIRRTLAHVERLPGDGSAATKARALLHQACNWPKMTVYSMEKDVPDDVFDAIEERVERFAVQYYHVTSQDDMKAVMKESDMEASWDKLRHGYVMVVLRDPRSGVSQRYALAVEKLQPMIDTFFIDIRDMTPLGPKATINAIPIKNMGDELRQQEEDRNKADRQKERDNRARKKVERAERRKKKADEKTAKKAAKKAAKAEEKAKVASAKVIADAVAARAAHDAGADGSRDDL